MTAPERHALLSPSAAARWLDCPGSVALEQTIDEPETESAAAAEGTRAHAALAAVLEGRPAGDAPDEMMAAVNTAADYILARKEETGARLMVERWLSLEHLGVPGLDGGTADCVLVGARGDIEVVDYKHGAGTPVAARRNPQLMMYALGAMRETLHEPAEVRLTIIQPRIPGYAGPDTWTAELIDLTSWETDVLVPRALDAAGGGAGRFPTAAACRWCRARAVCPDQRRMVEDAARVDFDRATPREIADLYTRLPLLRGALDAIEAHVRASVQRGESVFARVAKLVNKHTRRYYAEDADARLADVFGGDADAYSERRLVGLRVMEERLIDRVGRAEAKAVMAAVTRRPAPETTVVPISDRREAVVPNAVADFAEIEESGT